MIYVDIETDSNGKVLAIGHVDDNGTSVIISKNWKQFLTRFNASDLTMIAHNGGGFDWLSLLDYLLRSERLKDWQAICVGSHVICMDVELHGGEKIKLLDSWCLTQSSLDAAADALHIGRKVRIEKKPEDLPRAKMLEYLKNDVILLRGVYVQFFAEVNKIAPIACYPMTVASTALKVFEKFSDTRIRKVPDRINKEVMQAYTGGRVEVFKPGYHKHVNVYDINSMYPYVMRENKFPVDGTYTMTDKYVPGDIGFYYCDMGICGISPIIRMGKQVTQGRLMLASCEIDAVRRAGGTVNVDYGYCFENVDYIFREYIDTLYAIRIRKQPLSFVAKMMMNHLYGKFGQRSESSTLVFDPKSIENLRPLIKGKPFYEKVSERYVAHRHVAISALVTAYARVYLHTFIDKHTIYCDTDSIHTNKTMVTDNGLGKFKLEFSGEAIYLGKKLYMIRSGEKTKVTAKGIKTRGNPVYGGWCDLTWEDFSLLSNGRSIKLCEFTSMPTLLDVLSGKPSCKPQIKKRNIKMS